MASIKPKVVLMLSNKCNKGSRCRHCYLPLIDKFSPDKAQEVTAQLMKQGYEVTFTGGEILLEPDYLKCYESAGHKYLLTNGLLLLEKPSLFGSIKKSGIGQLVFSINFDLTETLGSVLNHKVIKAINLSKKQGLDVVIAVLITRKNFRNLRNYCEEAVKLGCSEIQFYRYVRLNRATLDSSYHLQDAHIQEFFDLWRQARQEFAGSLTVFPKMGFGPTENLRKKFEAQGKHYCPAGEYLFALTSDYRLYGGPCLVNRGMEIGEYADGQLRISRSIVGDRQTCIASNLPDIRIKTRDP